jgi:hypothetical protein
VSLPLTLRNHLVTQAVQVLVWGATLNSQLCARVTSDPMQGWWLQGSWGWLAGAAPELLAATSYPLQTEDLPAELPPHGRCLVLVWFMQLALGLVGTSAVVYHLELASRRAFLAGVAQAASEQPPGEAAAAEEQCLTGWRLVNVAGLALLVLWLVVANVVALHQVPLVGGG